MKAKANYNCSKWSFAILLLLFGWNIGLVLLGISYLIEKENEHELKKLLRRNPKLRAHALEMARSGQKPSTLGEALVADLAKYA